LAEDGWKDGQNPRDMRTRVGCCQIGECVGNLGIDGKRSKKADVLSGVMVCWSLIRRRDDYGNNWELQKRKNGGKSRHEIHNSSELARPRKPQWIASSPHIQQRHEPVAIRTLALPARQLSRKAGEGAPWKLVLGVISRHYVG
jgi:hypothetical protein